MVSKDEFIAGWPRFQEAGRNSTSLGGAPALPQPGDDNAARYIAMQAAADVSLEDELDAIM